MCPTWWPKGPRTATTTTYQPVLAEPHLELSVLSIGGLPQLADAVCEHALVCVTALTGRQPIGAQLGAVARVACDRDDPELGVAVGVVTRIATCARAPGRNPGVAQLGLDARRALAGGRPITVPTRSAAAAAAATISPLRTIPTVSPPLLRSAADAACATCAVASVGATCAPRRWATGLVPLWWANPL